VRALEGQHAEDALALQLIQSIRQEIGQVVPALLLLLQRRLFEDLLREVQSGGDDRLLERLQRLRDDIDEMDPADGSDWKHIAQQIRQLTGRSPMPN
jgi:hypothetical protein